MTFYELLDAVVDLLRRRGRASSRALKREFDLDDEILEDLRVELVDVQRVARVESEGVLVWTGDPVGAPAAAADPHISPIEPSGGAPSPAREGATPARGDRRQVDAERRQVTVVFCDLVRSTELASRLDPEELRDLLRAYQEAADEVIRGFDGIIARYVGDGLLIYFGYPHAHGDDAERAVRAGLGIVRAVRDLQARLQPAMPPLRDIPLRVRLGVHTGLAVVGALRETGARGDVAAVGETPNVAMRIEGWAAPDTIVITEATHRLLRGAVLCEAIAPRAIEGLADPVPLYRVLREREAAEMGEEPLARSTPLLGREREAGLLRQRWAEAADGLGQVAVVAGEAGIGKSRLIQALKAHVRSGPHRLLEARGAAYHQHSALYPLGELLHRALDVDRQRPAAEQLAHLERALDGIDLPAGEAVPLLAPVLGLPPPPTRPPIGLGPELQRRRTLERIWALVLALSAREPVLLIVEDLHWVDPSTLEWLSLVVEQAPTARLLALFTARPEFTSPWAGRSHVTHLTLSRLRPMQIEQLIGAIAGDKALPRPVVEQVVAKTDGVPLFVEELTKMVLESGLLREEADRYDLVGALPPLAIPATLQDSLLARLDRLSTVKAVAQIGAAIGRSFPYGLLLAASALDGDVLQRDLAKLVEAELLYQRGTPPEAVYTFKHALIQEAAYQTLLRSTRQQYHRRIARVLEAQFPAMVEGHPELLAQHYAEAGLGAEAIPHWHRAGETAAGRAAYIEAISHLTRALDALEALGPGSERAQREIALRLARGAALMAVRGHASPEVEGEYTRARALCGQVEDRSSLFRALGGLYVFSLARGELESARQFAEQCLAWADAGAEAAHRVRISAMVGQVWFYLGDLARARDGLASGISLYRGGEYRPRASGQDSIGVCLSYDAWALWLLGFPDRAQERSGEALALARQRGHPHDLAGALHYANVLDQLCREGARVMERAETLIALASEHGYPLWLALGHLMHGWARAEDGQVVPGLAEMRQGVAALRTTGQRTGWPYYLALMAGACGRLGDPAGALSIQSEAMAVRDETRERCWDSELYRLRGELLRQARGDAREAEACLRQGVASARRQGAPSWELRAATSLARLLSERDEREEARDLLAEAYARFTEGFETADLRAARGLLTALG